MSTKRCRRTNPLVTWALLLGVCLGAYFLYSVLVVPLVEVAAPLRGRHGNISEYPVAQENNDHHRWFAPDDWERQPCSILHTNQGKILFDDFEAEDPQTWFVKPFSLVLEREDQTQNALDGGARDAAMPLPPLILRCHSGARLFFDGPMMQQVSSAGNRLKKAFLQGKVELYRLETGLGKDDAIRIETSNVQITDSQVLTIDDVAFWFGRNQGIGRNLSIQLGHSAPGNSVTADFSNVNGIEKLELAFLTSLRLLPSSTSPAVGGPGSERLLSTDQTPIEITAAGAFEFDLAANRARFVDRVEVRKLDADKDTLRCQELLLKFKSSDGVSVFQLDAATEAEFELESITALGGKQGPAVLDARSKNARVIGSRLEYDLVEQRIAVSGGDRVEVLQGTDRFVAKSIVYDLTEDKSLGALLAEGPGQMLRRDGQKYFRAVWNDALSIRRQTDQQHAVRISGNTEIRLDQDTSIRSEELELLVWEVPVYDQANERVNWIYQPAQLIASQNVQIGSDKITGETARLVAQWPTNPQPAPQALSAVGKQQPDPVAPPADLHRLPKTQGHYATVARGHFVRRIDLDQVVEKQVPIHVSGREINVVLADQNGESQLVDLHVLGEVNVAKSNGSDRLQIRGDQLRLVPQGPELFQVRVAGEAGSPANVLSDRLNLAGPEIILDQQQNSIWVSGVGQLEMVGQSAAEIQLNQNANAGAGDSAITDQIRVAFVGGMVFDGLKIYFENQVVADIAQSKTGGTRSETRAAGNALSLTLDRSVNFRNLGNSISVQDPQVVAIVLRDRLPPASQQFKQVNFKTAKNDAASITNRAINPRGEITEQFTINAPHTEIDNLAKTMLAYGPGSVRIHRRGTDAGRNPSFEFGANRQTTVSRNELTYIHVNFDNQLTANTANNRIEMDGNLRGVYTPVENFEQYFDPDRERQLPPDAIRLDCNHMVLSRALNQFTGQLYNEFIASGNAEVWSSTFRSAADRFRYDQQTDLLTVESTSGGKVALQYRRDLNSDWQLARGSNFSYRLGDQQFYGENIDQISGTLGKLP